MSKHATMPEQSVLRRVRILFLGWLILTGIGTVFPQLRLWGVHLPAFLPLWAQFVFFGFALAVLLVPVSTWTNIVSRIPRLVPRAVRSSMTGICLAAAFIIFRVSAGLLGDGMLRGREAQLGMTRPAEILPGLLARWTYALLHPAFHITGQQAVAIVSVLAGCAFLLILWHYPRRIWEEERARMTARIWLLAGGATALFFGYVESYALSCVAIVGFLFAAEAYRRKRGSFVTCAAFFVLALASHLVLMALFPALVALSASPTKHRNRRLLIAAMIALAAGGWGYWALHASKFAQEMPAGSILVSVIPRPPVNYGLISPAHLLDIVNLLLLVCPGILIALPLLPGTRNSLSRTGSTWFWPAAAILPLGIPLLLDPKLGMARDWDLLALGLIPMLAWTALRLADSRDMLHGKSLMLPVFASAAVLVMFVAINANTTTAIARFERLLELDRARSAYGREILATWYHEHGRAEDEIHQWRKALEPGEHRRYWTSLSAAYLRAGDLANGFFAARRGYFLDTTYAYSAYYLGATFEEFEMFDSACTYYARAVRLAPRNFPMRHDLAMVLSRAGRVTEGLTEMETLLRLAPDSIAYQNAFAALLIETGRFNEASHIVGSVLERNPRDVSARANLAVIYHKTGRDDLALAEIAALLEFPDLPPKHRATLEELARSIRMGAPLPDSTR